MNFHDLRIAAEAFGLDRDVLRERFYDCRICTAFVASILDLSGRFLSGRGRKIDGLANSLHAAKLQRHDGHPPLDNKTLRSLIAQLFYDGSTLRPIAANPLLNQFASSQEAKTVRRHFSQLPLDYRVRMRRHTEATQNNLLLLKKYDEQRREKGVLLVAYTENMRRFAALFEVSKLAQHYMVVFEPSWWGYQSTTILFYLGSGLDVAIQAQATLDYEFLQRLNANIEPVGIGAGDWVDPDTFCPPPERAGSYANREFDVAVVGSWKPAKRHGEMFSALKTLTKKYGRSDLSVAVVGLRAGWKRKHIELLVEHYGLTSNCQIMEGVPHHRVSDILSDSRVYVLTSRREGANRAVYEAMFCDTPVVVYRKHRGVRTDDIRDNVGVLYSNGQLASAIDSVLQDPSRFSPRDWAIRNSGYQNASKKLNDTLRRIARDRGYDWSTDIVPKKNAFNLAYAHPRHSNYFKDEYRKLAQYLRED